MGSHAWICNVKGYRVCLFCGYTRKTSDRKFPTCDEFQEQMAGALRALEQQEMQDSK